MYGGILQCSSMYLFGNDHQDFDDDVIENIITELGV